jgi:hypothetical protein
MIHYVMRVQTGVQTLRHAHVHFLKHGDAQFLRHNSVNAC